MAEAGGDPGKAPLISVTGSVELLEGHTVAPAVQTAEETTVVKVGNATKTMTKRTVVKTERVIKRVGRTASALSSTTVSNATTASGESSDLARAVGLFSYYSLAVTPRSLMSDIASGYKLGRLAKKMGCDLDVTRRVDLGSDEARLNVQKFLDWLKTYPGMEGKELFTVDDVISGKGSEAIVKTLAALAVVAGAPSSPRTSRRYSPAGSPARKSRSSSPSAMSRTSSTSSSAVSYDELQHQLSQAKRELGTLKLQMETQSSQDKTNIQKLRRQVREEQEAFETEQHKSNANLDATVHKHNAEVASLRKELCDVQLLRDQLETQKNDVIRSLEVKVQTLTTTIETIETTTTTLRRKVQHFEATVDKLEATVRKQSEEILQKDQAILRAETEAVSKARALELHGQGRAEEAGQRAAGLQSRVEGLTRDLENERAAHAKATAGWAESLRTRDQAAAELQAECDRLREAAKASRDVEGLVDSAETATAELRRKMAALGHKASGLERDLLASRRRVDEASGLNAKYQSQLEALAAERSDLKTRLTTAEREAAQERAKLQGDAARSGEQHSEQLQQLRSAHDQAVKDLQSRLASRDRDFQDLLQTSQAASASASARSLPPPQPEAVDLSPLMALLRDIQKALGAKSTSSQVDACLKSMGELQAVCDSSQRTMLKELHTGLLSVREAESADASPPLAAELARLHDANGALTAQVAKLQVFQTECKRLRFELREATGRAGEADSQLAPLRKELEVSTSSTQSAELRAIVSEALASAPATVDRSGELAAARAEKEALIARLATLEAVGAEGQRLRAELKGVRRQLSAKEEEASGFRARLAELETAKADSAQVWRELEAANGRAQAAAANLAAVRAELVAASAASSSATTTTSTTSSTSTAKSVAELKGMLSRALAAPASKERAALETAQAEGQQLRAELGQANDRAAAAAKELSGVRKEFAGLRTELLAAFSSSSPSPSPPTSSGSTSTTELRAMLAKALAEAREPAPELVATREERDRLVVRVAEFGALQAECERLKRDLKAAEGKAQGATKDAATLRKELVALAASTAASSSSTTTATTATTLSKSATAELKTVVTGALAAAGVGKASRELEGVRGEKDRLVAQVAKLKGTQATNDQLRRDLKLANGKAEAAARELAGLRAEVQVSRSTTVDVRAAVSDALASAQPRSTGGGSNKAELHALQTSYRQLCDSYKQLLAKLDGLALADRDDGGLTDVVVVEERRGRSWWSSCCWLLPLLALLALLAWICLLLLLDETVPCSPNSYHDRLARMQRYWHTIDDPPVRS